MTTHGCLLILHLALDGGEWLASRSSLFIYEEKSLATHLTEDWFGAYLPNIAYILLFLYTYGSFNEYLRINLQFN
jgi:hypothetical protein